MTRGRKTKKTNYQSLPNPMPRRLVFFASSSRAIASSRLHRRKHLLQQIIEQAIGRDVELVSSSYEPFSICALTAATLSVRTSLD